jgi:hypothetical protein
MMGWALRTAVGRQIVPERRVCETNLAAEPKEFEKWRSRVLRRAPKIGKLSHGSRHAACAFVGQVIAASRFGTQRQADRTMTALIPIAVASRERPRPRPERRTNADFIAHLVATATQAPQTRARRRAEPMEAAVAYRMLGQWPSDAAEPGLIISRAL